MHGSCVITGAAGALGSELARSFASEGQRVALVGRSEAAARLSELERSLPTGTALSVAMDAASAASWNSELDRIELALGPIDSAVLAAGGWQGGHALHSAAGSAAFDAMFEMNVATVRHALETILPRLLARGRGSIVVIGSRAAERPWESANAAAYAASKAAVVALARAAAAEVLGSGVRINAVLPSIIDTPANRRAMPNADYATWVTAASLGRVIRFLLSDDARDISGAAIPVYGRVPS